MMQPKKDMLKKRISVASLALVFGIAAYVQFHNIWYISLGLIVAAGIVKAKKLPIDE